jgi:hypothetical protein
MKNTSSKAQVEITKIFCTIEKLSLQHIPFDEVLSFSAANKMGKWNAFPAANEKYG